MPPLAYAVLIGVPAVFGFLVGRWWALLAVIPLWIWIYLESEIEVEPWFIATAISVLVAVGIVLGVAIRKRASRANT